MVLFLDHLLSMRYLPLYSSLESREDGIPGLIFFGFGPRDLRKPIGVECAAEGKGVVLEGKANLVLLFHYQLWLKPIR